MVDITHKHSTLRRAVALAILKVSRPETIDAIRQRTVPKGDVFSFSKAAGLLACKKTHDVIPDCHPLPIEYADIRHEIEGMEIHVRVEVHTVYKTGVEVEAMHGAAITALTMYDMLKPLDDGIEISTIRLERKTGGKSDIKYAYPDTLQAAVITVSDTLSSGTGTDVSGDTVEARLRNCRIHEISRHLTPDDTEAIRDLTRRLVAGGCPLVVLTGGTGLSVRDCTPEAIAPLIDREVPGIMEAARHYGQQRTPYAMLSRGIAGFSGNTLVITLPGSPRGAAESMDAIFPYILHVFRVKEGVRHDV